MTRRVLGSTTMSPNPSNTMSWERWSWKSWTRTDLTISFQIAEMIAQSSPRSDTSIKNHAFARATLHTNILLWTFFVLFSFFFFSRGFERRWSVAPILFLWFLSPHYAFASRWHKLTPLFVSFSTSSRRPVPTRQWFSSLVDNCSRQCRSWLGRFASVIVWAWGNSWDCCFACFCHDTRLWALHSIVILSAWFFCTGLELMGRGGPGRGMVCQGASFMTGSFLCVDLNYIINSYRDCFFKIWSSKPVQLILLVWDTYWLAWARPLLRTA